MACICGQPRSSDGRVIGLVLTLIQFTSSEQGCRLCPLVRSSSRLFDPGITTSRLS